MKNIKKYMISLVTISSLGLATNSFATASADLLREFQQMESGHKADWINHMKEEKDSFFRLIKHEQRECSKLQASALQKFELLSGSNNEQTFNNVLNDAVALHKSQKVEWRTEHERIEQQARDIAAKHDKEFSAFIKKLTAQKKLHTIEPEEVLLGEQVVGDAPELPVL